MGSIKLKRSYYIYLLVFIALLTACSPKSIDTTQPLTPETTIAIITSSDATTVDPQELELEAIDAVSQDWGLGDNISVYVNNGREYDWYVDQATTGLHAGNNCGPSSIEMAAKWYDEDTKATAEKARKKFRSSGGWWYSDDINNALDLYDIPYKIIALESDFDLRNILDQGSIAIINNSMGYIPFNGNANERINRFYTFDSGHYLIVKGYVVADGKLYFEVYDPNNWNESYDDGEPKGKDRFYESSVLMSSILNWYPFAVVISEP